MNTPKGKNESDPLFASIKAQVVGIGGSPRKGGNSDTLLRAIAAGVRQGEVAAETTHLRDLCFKPCIGCEQCRKRKRCTGLKDGMSLLYPEIIAAKGLVLVSPTHNYNITAWMKAFIDRLYCFYEFDNHRPRGWSSRLAGQGRKAVLVAVCEQNSKADMGFTLEAMRLPIEALGYEIIGELAVFNLFERAKVKELEETMIRATALGVELAKAVSI